MKHNSISVLSKLACDPLRPGIRKHALVAIVELAKDPQGAKALVEAGIVRLLITRCDKETDGLQAAALMALHQCMSISAGLATAIGNLALPVIVTRLESVETLAREKAALCLGAYASNMEEKSKADEVQALECYIVVSRK